MTGQPGTPKYDKETIELYKDKIPYSFYEILMHRAEVKGRETIAKDLNIPIGTAKSRLHRAESLIDRLVELDRAALEAKFMTAFENA